MEVASGGFLGLGERTSFIPVSAITRVTDTDVLISRTGAPAAGASRYDPDVVAVDPDYAENMYPYLGDSGYLGLFPVTRGYTHAMKRKARPKRSDG